MGRGLDALLPGNVGAEAAAASGDGLREIPVDRIRTNPRQSRQVFDQERLAELAASIEEVGLVQPVVVRQSGDGYELISGERRLRAFLALGRSRIPAVVREMPEVEAAMAVLIENIQRENLNPLEEAIAYRRLVNEFDLTQEEVARRVGKSRVHVTNTLRLLSLPLQVQEIIGSGALTAGHARALGAVDDAARQVELAQRAVARGLSVRALEEEVRNAAAQAASSRGSRKRDVESGLKSLLRERAGALAARVNIRGDQNKGRIEIRYRNEQELEEVLDWLAYVSRKT
ncbi:parB-like partition protein [Candidatus Desulforudis audaxviator MP104C]|uniref:ParB-like partition protein n=1 Tax=Desulforudis audaxviator (strain MP104C) TaxID=477974 RepID=B1I6R8_DESAP|nr:parB-like partition protein [Candidatus Desulforudis audaxviator MP104C]